MKTFFSNSDIGICMCKREMSRHNKMNLMAIYTYIIRKYVGIKCVPRLYNVSVINSSVIHSASGNKIQFVSAKKKFESARFFD